MNSTCSDKLIEPKIAAGNPRADDMTSAFDKSTGYGAKDNLPTILLS
jgi:hypothetical protein